jgi:SAM-dependent methyltransferase
MDSKSHWEQIYRNKLPTQVSWYQPHALRSLALIRRVSPPPNGAIIDVGGGASTLADDLLDAGYRDLTVLDLSAAALAEARIRLGSRAGSVRWIEADILDASLPKTGYSVWHDRAVFHFLTAPGDRARYVAQVRRAVRSGGFVLVATFADDGPTQCSGLEVHRYSPEALHAEFGAPFRLMASEREEHVTPAGVRQAFIYCLCRVDA